MEYETKRPNFCRHDIFFGVSMALRISMWRCSLGKHCCFRLQNNVSIFGGWEGPNGSLYWWPTFDANLCFSIIAQKTFLCVIREQMHISRRSAPLWRCPIAPPPPKTKTKKDFREQIDLSASLSVKVFVVRRKSYRANFSRWNVLSCRPTAFTEDDAAPTLNLASIVVFLFFYLF